MIKSLVANLQLVMLVDESVVAKSFKNHLSVILLDFGKFDQTLRLHCRQNSIPQNLLDLLELLLGRSKVEGRDKLPNLD